MFSECLFDFWLFFTLIGVQTKKVLEYFEYCSLLEESLNKNQFFTLNHYTPLLPIALHHYCSVQHLPTPFQYPKTEFQVLDKNFSKKSFCFSFYFTNNIFFSLLFSFITDVFEKRNNEEYWDVVFGECVTKRWSVSQPKKCDLRLDLWFDQNYQSFCDSSSHMATVEWKWKEIVSETGWDLCDVWIDLERGTHS